MTKVISSIGLLAFALAAGVGCSGHTSAQPEYKASIDNYFQAHPSCLWVSDKKFPTEASAQDASGEGYDALVDQGLLTRTKARGKTAEYEISAKGQPFWVADSSQPGYGNFCYGHRQVVSIDNSSGQTATGVGAIAMVSYHYTMVGVPAWASSPEMQAAFPRLAGDMAPQISVATVTDTNQGWQMTPPAVSQPTSAANEPAPAASGKKHKPA